MATADKDVWTKNKSNEWKGLLMKTNKHKMCLKENAGKRFDEGFIYLFTQKNSVGLLNIFWAEC